MPTPSDITPLASSRRSIFGNYQSPPAPGDPPAPAAPPPSALPQPEETLQESIERALCRAFLCRFLAQAYSDPEPAGWDWLSDPSTHAALRSASQALHDATEMTAAVVNLLPHLSQAGQEAFDAAYLAAFGHTVRGDCPMNEIEYGDIKADPLFQPHRLADLGAFYTAFGMEMAPDAAERQDHIGIELEFLSVLHAKEAYGLEHQLDADQLDVVRDAQQRFLREHLARWAPAFTRRLIRTAGAGPLTALAELTSAFLQAECRRLRLQPGSEDLLLRPVDDSTERLCASCGIANLPPGAEPGPAHGA